MRKAKVFTSDNSLNVDKYLNSGSMRINRNLNTNGETTGVKIIELDNSVTSDSDDEHQNVGRQHAWCYTDMKQRHNYHNINKGARERRRMKNKVCPDFMIKYSECLSRSNREINSQGVATESYNSVCGNIAKEEPLTNNAWKYFDDSDSSSDKENGIEVTQCGDVILEPNQQNSEDHVKEIKYRKDLDSSRRTILIYSFKNRNNLGDEAAKVIKEYNEDSTSESSLEGLGSTLLDDKCDYRGSSPTPPPYIPRLNYFAAATLPTVAEVTEPCQFSSNNIEMYANNKTKLSSNNVWVERKKNYAYQEKFLTESRKHDDLKTPPVASGNIINWMALSPRARKRDIFPNLKNLVVENSISRVHKAKHEPTSDAVATASKAELNTDLNKTLDVDDATDNWEILEQTNNQFAIDEKGDHNEGQQLKKPRIRLERIITTNISDPIEKLDGEGWIGLEYEREDEPDWDMHAPEGLYEDDMSKPRGTNKCAGDRLIRKNMSLLKPVEWSGYLSITESVPSLHLSIPSDLSETGRPWLKRFIRLFRCCKYK